MSSCLTCESIRPPELRHLLPAGLVVAKRLECAELAPAFQRGRVSKSGSKLRALQTLRDILMQHRLTTIYPGRMPHS